MRESPSTTCTPRRERTSAALAWTLLAGCASPPSPDSTPPAETPSPAAAADPPAEASPDAAAADATPEQPLTPVCYVFRRAEPPGTFSGCFVNDAACTKFLGERRPIFEEQGGTFERACAASPEATCLVATDGAGQITFRSCAATPAICEEQRQRSARGIRDGMVTGPSPTCRPATRADLERRPEGRAPGVVSFSE